MRRPSPTVLKMPDRKAGSDRHSAVSQNDDENQNEDQEYHGTRSEEYGFAHSIGLQQVFATHLGPPR